MSDLAVCPAGPGDLDVVLGLFDEAVADLVARGFREQWGERPWSSIPERRDLIGGWLATDGGHLATTPGGRVVGYLHLGDPPRYVAAASVPEVYVLGLVGSTRPEGRGAGRLLLDHAAAVARERGVGQLRVDCYAGNGGRLVAFYESCGFTGVDDFTVGDGWTGRVLVRDPG